MKMKAIVTKNPSGVYSAVGGSDERFVFINEDDFAALAAEHGYIRLKPGEEVVSRDFYAYHGTKP